MSYRRHERFLGLFSPPRWPDGQAAKTTDDRICQAMLLGWVALALTCAVVTWWDGSFSAREYLIATPIAPLAWFSMNWRLRAVVRRAEKNGVPCPQDRPRSIHERILEFGARKSDDIAQKLLVRATNKEAQGEDKEAARLRRLAAKEKAQAVSVRALIKK